MKTPLVLFIFHYFLLTNHLTKAEETTTVIIASKPKDVSSTMIYPENSTAQTLTSPQLARTKPNETVDLNTTRLTDPAEPGSPSLLSALSPRILQLLDQLSVIIPGLRDRLDSGFGLSTSELKTINDFVQLLTNTMKNAMPMTVEDILKTLQSSGLFTSIAKGSDLSSMTEDVRKQALAVCDNIKSLNSDMNTTIGTLMNMTQFLGNTQFVNMTLKDVSDRCHELVKGPPKAPKGWVHSPYYWKKCKNDLMQALRFDQWALQSNFVIECNQALDNFLHICVVLDASGKPGSGILEGNFKFMGNYKECQKVFHKDADTLSIIEGKICRAHIKLPASLFKPSVGSWLQVPRVQWDICLPKSCQDSDLNLALYEQSLSDDIWMVCTKELDISTDSAAIVAIGVLTLFGVLLVAGTIMEICLKYQKSDYTNYRKFATNGHVNNGFEVKYETTEPNGKPAMVELNVQHEEKTYPVISMKEEDMNGYNGTAVHFTEPPNGNVCHEKKDNGAKQNDIGSQPKWQKALLAFSIPRNTGKILGVSAAPGAIGCLHGIRVLSMGWVILGHVLIFQATSGQFQNPTDILSQITTLSFQLIINAPLSVDTFFFMSGFLTCYLYLKTLGKKGRITVKEFIMYYVHRYWRLTPSLLIWMMVVACLLQYIGEGRPAWTDFAMADNCRKNWWVNILYINNVYKQEEGCMGVTWFLAHDMQFYVVAPLALIPWVYGQKALGFLASIVFIGIHIASTIWLEVKYNSDLLRNQPEYSREIYFKPYTRVAPFAIGLMMGWGMWKTKGKIKMNKYLVALAWLVCFGLILVLTLVTYDENKDLAHSWSKTSRVVFETFYRPLWSIAIGWLIFACATGYGGYINSILSWEGWLPLSRLTYSAFLIHLTIIGYEVIIPEYTMLYTLTSLSYQFIGYFVMAYAVGFILTVSVESPMLALEKVILG